MKLSLITALNATLVNQLSTKDRNVSTYAIPVIPEDTGGQVMVYVEKHLDMSEAIGILITNAKLLDGFTITDTEAMRHIAEVFIRPSEWQYALMCGNTKSGKRLVYCIDATRGYLDIDIETCIMTDAAYWVRDPMLVEHRETVSQYQYQQGFIRKNKNYPLVSWGLSKNACVQFGQPFTRSHFGFYNLVVNPNKLFTLSEIMGDFISIVGTGSDTFENALDYLISEHSNSEDDKVINKTAITAFLNDPSTPPRSPSTVAYHSNVIHGNDGDYTFHMRCFPDGFSEMILLEGASEELVTAIKNSITQSILASK